MSSTRREFLKNASAVAASVGLASSIDAQTLKRSGFVSPLTASDDPYHPQDAGIRELCMLALDAAKSAGADYADVRFSQNRSRGSFARERRVQGLSDSDILGFGIRVLVGGSCEFAASSDVSKDERARVATQSVSQAKANRAAQRTFTAHTIFGTLPGMRPGTAGASALDLPRMPANAPYADQRDQHRPAGESVSGYPRSNFDGARYLSRSDCEALAKRTRSYSSADSRRIVINSGNRGNTRFAANQISTAGENYSASVSISTTFGKRTGCVNTIRLDEASLRESVRSAEALAKRSPENPEAMPELEPQQYADSLGWSEATASLDPARRSGATREIGEAARAAGLVATGYVETVAGATAIANSRGNFAYGRQTQLAFTTPVRTPDGSGSGWAGTAGHDCAQVDSKRLARRAIEKAKRSVNPVAVERGRFTVILEATAVGNLPQVPAFSMRARAADERRSFFSKPGGGTKNGTKVTDERVTFVSDASDGDAFAVDGRAVKNLCFNESPVFTLNNVEKLGKPERVSASESGGTGSAIVVPPIKVRDFNFTSLSDAI